MIAGEPKPFTMKPITTGATLKIETLDLKSRDALLDELYPLQVQIFSGVSKSYFRKFILSPHATKTRLRKFFNDSGQLVGYISFHIFEFRLAGGLKQVVFKSEVGLLPAYRGHNSSMHFLIWQCLTNFLISGTIRVWFLASPIHPNPYALAGQQLHKVYPSPFREMPAKYKALSIEIMAALDFQPTEKELQYKVNWVVRESMGSQNKLYRSECPWTNHYLKLNPDHGLGFGLLMMIPMTPMNLFWSLGNSGKRLFKKWIKKLPLQSVIGPESSSCCPGELVSICSNSSITSEEAPESFLSTKAILSSTLRK